jgi:low molecular weight protein-tyrosine phosphatase
MGKKIKVLFVCLGNICRSPGAEAVFKDFVKKKGEEKLFDIDSAGTSAWHAGEKADARMRFHARKRGIIITSISRKFEIEDFDHFDFILVMDHENLAELKKLARNKSDINKLYMMTDFSKRFHFDQVPDPYYGGDEGFELVLDLLEDSGKGLYQYLKNKAD